MRRRRFVIALALCAVCGDSALAQSHEMMMHHGVPSRIVADQRVGPYIASVWIERDVGDGAVYVILDAADGVSFIPPSAVRVALVPTSGRIPEVVNDAHPELVRGSREARYMTTVMFDRPERWNLRVSVEGSAGGGQLVSQVESTSNAALGPLGVFLASTPFVLVAFVYWRARRARRLMVALRPRHA
ncbi:MAG TPA: hypothetical protein VJN70_04010 [Gemmatimonadaceae bacterium]|nr:hypothetical protein [Gemmatimonadaceae bacterium]